MIKSKFLIKAFLVLAILLIGIYFIWYDTMSTKDSFVDNENNTTSHQAIVDNNIYDCEQDSDCVLVSKYEDCCALCTWEAVNIYGKEYLNKERSKCDRNKCPIYDCMAWSQKAVCDNGKCAVKDMSRQITVETERRLELKTDKKEYQKDELVNIKIKNNTVNSIDIVGVSVEQFVDDKWIEIDNDIECPCFAKCDRAQLLLSTGDRKNFYWGQGSNMIIDRISSLNDDSSSMWCDKVDVGKYRIKTTYFRYNSKKPIEKIPAIITTYSDEFKIVTKTEENRCDILKKNIKEELENNNYCQTKDDCVVANDFYGCIYGCWQLRNKNANLTNLQNLDNQYVGVCIKCENECTISPQSRDVNCIKNRCMIEKSDSSAVIKTDKEIYEPREPVKIIVNSKTIIYPVSAFDIFKFDNNQWQNIDMGFCGNEARCENNQPTIKDCKSIVVFNDSTFKTTWFQRYSSAERQVCLENFFGSRLRKKAENGKYKVSFSYTLDDIDQDIITIEKIFFIDDTQNKNEEIQIIIDKDKYSENENISATITNNSTKDIWLNNSCNNPFYLYRKENNDWNIYYPYPIKDCRSQAIKINSRQEYSKEFDFNVYDGSKLGKIKPGTYKFKISYTEYDMTELKIGVKPMFFEVFSDEFIITKQQGLKNEPKIVGSYISAGESSQIAVRGNIVYMTDIVQGLLSIDASDPKNPKLLDSLKIDNKGAYAIALDNSDFAYVSGYGNSKIAKINIGDPKNLKIIKIENAKRSIQNLTAFDGFSYISIDGPEFEIFSNTFKSLGVYPGLAGGHVLDLAISSQSLNDKKLLITEGEKGFSILGMSILVIQNSINTKEKNQSLIKNINIGGYPNAVAIDRYELSDKIKEHAYVLNGSELVIVDILNAKNPKIKSKLKLSAIGSDIDVFNGFAVVAQWESGVEIINVANPDLPFSIAMIDTSGRARGVAMNEEYVYVADDRGGLQIIKL